MKILSIGRIATNDIVLTDPMVSRQHAQLTILDNGRVLIKDTGSSNGTYVNGNKIAESYLEAGDIVKCGGVFLNWSQYLRKGPPMGEPNKQPGFRPKPSEVYSEQSGAGEMVLPYTFGSVVRSLSSRIFQTDDFFKTDWERTPSILYFLLGPFTIFFIGVLYFYFKVHIDFLNQVFLPLILFLLVFGVSQFLTLSLISVNRNTNFSKNLFASSIFSFLQFVQLMVLVVYAATVYGNYDSFGKSFNHLIDPSLAGYFILGLLAITIFISISFALLIFIYKYFRGIGVTKSISIHTVIISITLNILIQSGLVYLLVSISGNHLFKL